jgi:hypothetical protein
VICFHYYLHGDFSSAVGSHMQHDYEPLINFVRERSTNSLNSSGSTLPILPQKLISVNPAFNRITFMFFFRFISVIPAEVIRPDDKLGKTIAAGGKKDRQANPLGK